MDTKLILFGLATLGLALFFGAFIRYFGKIKAFSVKNSFLLIGLFFFIGVGFLAFSLYLLKARI